MLQSNKLTDYSARIAEELGLEEKDVKAVLSILNKRLCRVLLTGNNIYLKGLGTLFFDNKPFIDERKRKIEQGKYRGFKPDTLYPKQRPIGKIGRGKRKL